MSSLPAVVPEAIHDLRGRVVGQLHYPANAVLVVAGVPGAGKTTLLRRVFATAGAQCLPAVSTDGVRLLDSEQSRAWWRRYLGLMPYAVWRPIVHATHYGRLVRTLRVGGGPMVVHDCATRPWARRLIIGSARRSRRSVHLLLLDVTPQVASEAQVARGRSVRPSSFAAHCRRWRSLVEAVDDGDHTIHRETASIVVIDRPTAARLTAIQFTAPPLSVRSAGHSPCLKGSPIVQRTFYTTGVGYEWWPWALDNLVGIEAYEVSQVIAARRRLPLALTVNGLPAIGILGRTTAGRPLLVAVRRLTEFDQQIIGAREQTDAELAQFEAWEAAS